MLTWGFAVSFLFEVDKERGLEELLAEVSLIKRLAQGRFVEVLQLAQGEFIGQKAETDRTALDAALDKTGVESYGTMAAAPRPSGVLACACGDAGSGDVCIQPLKVLRPL